MQDGVPSQLKTCKAIANTASYILTSSLVCFKKSKKLVMGKHFMQKQMKEEGMIRKLDNIFIIIMEKVTLHGTERILMNIKKDGKPKIRICVYYGDVLHPSPKIMFELIFDFNL